MLAAPTAGERAVRLTLVSHHLCPFVQRAAIALLEKGVEFERRTIDLANKPDWFLQVSPLGRTPVLLVGQQPIFESSVILEYLEDSQAKPLHPSDPLRRAQHRAWVEFASAVLHNISAFYTADTPEQFDTQLAILEQRLSQLEMNIFGQPYFDGQQFSLVDAAFGPVFRYFDTFDRIRDFGFLAGKPRLAAWRAALNQRPSVQAAVSENYAQDLWQFLLDRRSNLTRLMRQEAAIAPAL